ncbi:hypothetical protein KKG83_06120 [Candidatus Micrarchaeota archaeon]|nr:hypothetical protein [Candidatus Micrarchaeota archaeon]
MSLGFEFTSSLISFVISFLTVILFFGSIFRFNEGKMKSVLNHFFYSLLVFTAGQLFILVMVFLDYEINLIYGIRAFFVIATAIGLILTSFEALDFAKKFGMKNKRLF